MWTSAAHKILYTERPCDRWPGIQKNGFVFSSFYALLYNSIPANGIHDRCIFKLINDLQEQHPFCHNTREYSDLRSQCLDAPQLVEDPDNGRVEDPEPRGAVGRYDKATCFI